MARLHTIKAVDIENTFWGVSTSLWFNYCPHRCFNCWNEDTWDLNADLQIDNAEIVAHTLTALDSYGLAKDLTVLGGEPFAASNIEDLIYILQEIKHHRPHTRVLAWSGYEYYILKRHWLMSQALSYIDVIVCGRYIDEWNCANQGKMYGSDNQYIVNVSKSLETGITNYIEKGSKFQNLELKFQIMQEKRKQKIDKTIL